MESHLQRFRLDKNNVVQQIWSNKKIGNCTPCDDSKESDKSDERE